jgi:hypothetical protein|tara:strand:+ start:2180 stop:2356 length:177 start_codon:yes stop_codon:yes gene_type:complete
VERTPEEIFKDADPDVLDIFGEVINIEMMYQLETSPRGVAEEIINIIKKKIDEQEIVK